MVTVCEILLLISDNTISHALCLVKTMSRMSLVSSLDLNLVMLTRSVVNLDTTGMV